MSFGLGFEFYAFILDVNYNLWLNNISIEGPDGYKLSNRDLRLSLGYKFGNKWLIKPASR
jgi:hypothetical protein